MKRYLCTFVMLAIVLNEATPTWADVELATSYSRARFLGDLSQEKAAPLFGLHLRYWSEPRNGDARWVLRPGISLDVLSTKTRNDGTDFPFQQNDEVRILAFLFVPTLCGQMTDLELHACVAIGQGTVNVNSSTNRQDYGSWNYQMDLKWGRHWIVGLMAKFVGKIEQRIEDKDSEFSFQSLGLSVGKIL